MRLSTSGAVCGAVRGEDIKAGKVRISGRLLVGEEARVALAQPMTE